MPFIPTTKDWRVLDAQLTSQMAEDSNFALFPFHAKREISNNIFEY